MKTELPISQLEIKQVMNHNYGITISNMEFIPQGMCSWSYHLYSNDGKEYFLKILKSDDLTPYTEDSLVVLHNLRDTYAIDQLPYPYINKNGKYVTKVDNYLFELFEFLSGETDEQKRFNDQQWYQVGKLLAQIHSHSKHLQSFPNKETFETEYIIKAKKLKQVIEDSRSKNIQSNVFDLLNTVLDPLTKIIHEFENLQHTLQSTMHPSHFVFCHSDPTPGNVMSDAKGKVFLIDWDTPIFAPAEKDLVCIADRESAMNGYRSIIPNITLNGDIKRFYGLCWTIDLILDHVPVDFNLEKNIPQDNLDHLKRNLIEYGLLIS